MTIGIELRVDALAFRTNNMKTPAGRAKMIAAMVLVGVGCRQASVADGQGSTIPASAPAQSGTASRTCVYRENGFRSGVNPPREVHRVEPDLSGLPPLADEQIAIIEVRIDETGRVTESCMLRGVREDVDRKALEAVNAWRFEPPRLRADTNLTDGERLEAGTAVPIFMTVTMRLGRRL